MKRLTAFDARAEAGADDRFCRDSGFQPAIAMATHECSGCADTGRVVRHESTRHSELNPDDRVRVAWTHSLGALPLDA